jgi:hypothetical protein
MNECRKGAGYESGGLCFSTPPVDDRSNWACSVRKSGLVGELADRIRPELRRAGVIPAAQLLRAPRGDCLAQCITHSSVLAAGNPLGGFSSVGFLQGHAVPAERSTRRRRHLWSLRADDWSRFQHQSSARHSNRIRSQNPEMKAHTTRAQRSRPHSDA